VQTKIKQQNPRKYERPTRNNWKITVCLIQWKYLRMPTSDDVELRPETLSVKDGGLHQNASSFFKCYSKCNFTTLKLAWLMRERGCVSFTTEITLSRHKWAQCIGSLFHFKQMHTLCFFYVLLLKNIHGIRTSRYEFGRWTTPDQILYFCKCSKSTTNVDRVKTHEHRRNKQIHAFVDKRLNF